MTTRKIEIFCTSEDQKTSGFANVRDLAMTERVWRGFKVGAIFFVLALLSVFIPILHFVLVPGFLLASLIFGFASWYSKSEITGGVFTCPNCQRANELETMDASFPYVTRCAGCSFTLTLKLCAF